jgi:hypothetical protein
VILPGSPLLLDPRLFLPFEFPPARNITHSANWVWHRRRRDTQCQARLVRDRQHRPLTVAFPFSLPLMSLLTVRCLPFRSVCSFPICTSDGPCFPGSCALAFVHRSICNSRLPFPLPVPVGSTLLSRFMDSFLVYHITCMSPSHVPQSDNRVGSDLPPFHDSSSNLASPCRRSLRVRQRYCREASRRLCSPYFCPLAAAQSRT